MKNFVIYPGTFDPITLGHEDLVKRAAQIFDRIIIAVGVNEQKKPLFSLEKRVALIHQVFKDMPQIEIETFDGLLINFAKKKGVKSILRGLRVVSDFDYEFQMASMNRALVPEIETIFLTPADRFTYISSSLVRVVIENGGDVSQFVPPIVAEAIS